MQTVPGARIVLRVDVVDERGAIVDGAARHVALVVRDTSVASVAPDTAGALGASSYVLSVRTRGRTWVVGTTTIAGALLSDSTRLFTGSVLAARP